MRHNPATTLLLALGAIISTVKAGNDNRPVPKSGLQESWASPAKETVAAGHENGQQVALGWSPKPTQAPKPLLGRMMMPRADDGYTLGPETGTSTLPACYTWVISTSASTDDSASLYTMFGCSLEAGRGTLLTVDPGWLSTHSFGPTTTTTSAESSSTTSASTSPTAESTNKSSSTPVGAIAGGTVGGVVALGLVGLAAFLFIRRRNPRNAPLNATLGQPPQGQNPAGGVIYSSGVPVGYQGGYAPVPMQQGYDARMNQYGQYPQQYPGQQPFQGQYPPQQQYNYPAQTASTSPVYTAPSPGAFKDGEMSPLQQSPPSELPTVSPVGAETNRAELGNSN
ncbi:hypothetical protein ACHAQJ_006779 [Trichoderma viride]